MGVSGSFSGGLIACPTCNHQFVLMAPVAHAGGGPSRGGMPELLDKLPKSLPNRAGFRVAAGLGVAVYGIGLAFAMTSLKANPANPHNPLRDHQAHSASDPASVAAADPTKGGLDPRSATRPEGTPAIAAPPPQVAKVDVPASKPPEPSPTPNPAPAPAPSPAPGPKTLGFDALGGLVDPGGDCQLAKDAQGVTINVAGSNIKAHLHELRSSPRALAEVEGDFDARVTLTGAIKPGFEPVKRLPICFQGAGLLLWQDESSFLRLERSAASNDGRHIHYHVLLEASKDGLPAVEPAYVDIPDGPIIVRLERKGGEYVASYGSDGQNWTELKKFKAEYAPKLGVGLSASSTSRKNFAARFEGFAITKP